jgi:hypothetical protein
MPLAAQAVSGSVVQLLPRGICCREILSRLIGCKPAEGGRGGGREDVNRHALRVASSGETSEQVQARRTLGQFALPKFNLHVASDRNYRCGHALDASSRPRARTRTKLGPSFGTAFLLYASRGRTVSGPCAVSPRGGETPPLLQPATKGPGRGFCPRWRNPSTWEIPTMERGGRLKRLPTGATSAVIPWQRPGSPAGGMPG